MTPRRAVVALCALAMLLLPAAAVARHGAPRTAGARLWVSRYDGPADDYDRTAAVGVDPSGATIFVTGWSTGIGTGWDFATVAYGADTGSRRWLKRYDGPGNGADYAHALDVGPDGSTLFVTGEGWGPTGTADFETVAYDAATGAKVWAKGYDGPANGDDAAFAVGAAPDGSKVFVTGRSAGKNGDAGYATVAYDTGTGARLWATRYKGPGSGDDDAAALSVSPDGAILFVTGGSMGSGGDRDYATVAYDTRTGAQLWVRRYNGPANGADMPHALGVSPDGSKLLVTGESTGAAGGTDFATVAYDAAGGAQLWARRYDGPGHGSDLATSLGVSPDGSRVFVTGGSTVSSGGLDYTTVGYDTAAGVRLWAKTYDGAGKATDFAFALGVGPDGSKLFVTGQSAGQGGANDFATVAYDAATGARLWARRYDGPGHDGDVAVALAPSPYGSSIFVTGRSVGSGSSYDYATVAYGSS